MAPCAGAGVTVAGPETRCCGVSSLAACGCNALLLQCHGDCTVTVTATVLPPLGPVPRCDWV